VLSSCTEILKSTGQVGQTGRDLTVNEFSLGVRQFCPFLSLVLSDVARIYCSLGSL
jgi:hypothetical protein